MNNDFQLVRNASAVAYVVHNGQFRKYSHNMDPYIIHLARAFGLVMLAEPERMTVRGFAATWLHDSKEETGVNDAFLLERGITREVIELVDILTRPAEPGVPRKDRVAGMVEKLRRAPWEAKVIKLADRADNLDDMATDPTVPKDFAVKYAGESRLLLDALKGTSVFLEARLTYLIYAIEYKFGGKVS